MARLSPDTHPDAERVQIELMRQAPAWRKLMLVGQMIETCRTLAISGLRQRHPGETPERLRLRLAALTLGPEEAARVYGQAPQEASGGTGTDCRHPVGGGGA